MTTEVQLTDDELDRAEQAHLTDDEARLAKDLHNLLLTGLDNNIRVSFVIGLLEAKSDELARAANTELVHTDNEAAPEDYDVLPIDIDDQVREGILSDTDFVPVQTVPQDSEAGEQ